MLPADSEAARDLAAKANTVCDTAAKKAKKPAAQKDKDEENARALVLPTARIRRIIKSEPDFCILGGDAVALISKSTVAKIACTRVRVQSPNDAVGDVLAGFRHRRT